MEHGPVELKDRFFGEEEAESQDRARHTMGIPHGVPLLATASHLSAIALATEEARQRSTVADRQSPLAHDGYRAQKYRKEWLAPQVIHCKVSGFKGFENSVSCSKDKCHFFLSSKYHRA
jgi:hypothetical protein